MNTLLEVLGLILLVLAVIALWFIFHGDPSLIELWHRAAMQSAGGTP
jgi:hypothetical protein